MSNTNKSVTPWGEIGYPIFKRTYARRINEDQADSPTEEFHQAVDRVVAATNYQLGCGFNMDELNELAEILTTLKGSVAGRFWWQLGTNTVSKLGLLSLQNCAFVIVDEPIRPFTWAMDALMLGSGKNI